MHRAKGRTLTFEEKSYIGGLGSNGTAKSLKAFTLFLKALTRHVLLHLALQMNNAQAY
jgi:hypothetical protein